jgi:hypothetical protein
MSALVLCNLGNSDLQADGQRPRQPRADGERLWQEFGEQRLVLPIIEPCLAHLLGEGVTIERLVLFYTDQPSNPQTEERDRNGISLRDKDTLWYARIAARLLRERLGDRPGAIELQRVERGRGQDINPSMYDEAFDAYGDLIARVYTPGDTSCYVLMAGGIPACNAALQIQALSAYGQRCRFIYQPEGGAPYELRVGAQIQATFRRATALEALDRRDFATALRNVEALEHPDPALIELLRYACYREAFDFERARAALSRSLRAANGAVRIFLTELRPELERLIDRNDMAALLREVHASARITYENGRYADFLGRVFRFQEAALRYIVEQKLGLPTDMSKANEPINGPAFRNGIASDSGLKAALEATTIDGKPLRFETPNLPTMQAMLRYITEPAACRPDGSPYLSKADIGRYGQAKKLLDKISALAQLRNRSIIAHGFAGVSREALDAACGGDAAGIVREIAEVIKLVGLGTPDSPFDRIAEQAAAMLRRSA